MSEISGNSEHQENCVQGSKDEVVEPVAGNKSILAEASPEVETTTAVVAATSAIASVAAEEAASADKADAAPRKENVIVAAAEAEAEAESEAVAKSPKVENKKTPAKRTPSKRMSFIERAQKESEELVKNLGGSLELEGGRRTRSSTRGTPTRSVVVATPPPAKKSRASPAASSSTPSRRGRGRKIDISSEPVDIQTATDENKKSEETEEATESGKSADNDAEKSSVENAENSVVDAANTAAAAEEQEAKASEVLEKDEGSKTNATSSSSEDIADGALEVIPEEKQNNVDHHVTVEESKNDSPMDTDEEPKCGSDPEPIDAAVKEANEKIEPSQDVTSSITTESLVSEEVKEKEPTPEPMEVDSSSSKDNNEDEEIESLQLAESGEKEITAVTVESSEASATEVSVLANSSKSQNTTDDCVVIATEVENVEETSCTTGAVIEPVVETVDETHKTESTLVNDLKIAGANDDDPSAAGEPQATTNVALETTATGIDKSENELCEPKIVSPPKSESAVAATPQYCN